MNEGDWLQEAPEDLLTELANQGDVTISAGENGTWTGVWNGTNDRVTASAPTMHELLAQLCTKAFGEALEE